MLVLLSSSRKFSWQANRETVHQGVEVPESRCDAFLLINWREPEVERADLRCADVRNRIAGLYSEDVGGERGRRHQASEKALFKDIGASAEASHPLYQKRWEIRSAHTCPLQSSGDPGTIHGDHNVARYELVVSEPVVDTRCQRLNDRSFSVP